MKIFELLGKGLDVVKLARNLQGATSSRITRTQAGATLIACLAVAGLAMIPGSPLADFAVATAAVTLLAPLLSRVIGKKQAGEKLSPSELLDEIALMMEEEDERAARREDATEIVVENRDALRAKVLEMNEEAVRRVQARKASGK